MEFGAVVPIAEPVSLTFVLVVTATATFQVVYKENSSNANAAYHLTLSTVMPLRPVIRP